MLLTCAYRAPSRVGLAVDESRFEVPKHGVKAADVTRVLEHHSFSCDIVP